MTDMLNRIMRALENIGLDSECLIDDAREIMETMRKPTLAMLQAGVVAFSNHDPRYDTENNTVFVIWADMLATALETEEK